MHADGERFDERAFFKAHVVWQLEGEVGRMHDRFAQATVNGGRPETHVRVEVVHALQRLAAGVVRDAGFHAHAVADLEVLRRCRFR